MQTSYDILHQIAHGCIVGLIAATITKSVAVQWLHKPMENLCDALDKSSSKSFQVMLVLAGLSLIAVGVAVFVTVVNVFIL